MERYEQIGRRIRQAREAEGLTQEELGRRLGISGVALGHYERAARSVGIAELERIAEALGKPITWFLQPPRPWADLVRDAYARVRQDPTYPHGARHEPEVDAALQEYIVRLYEQARAVRLLPSEEERLDFE
ncbi:MAG TPA: helix-turn-helix transcriptional regulator [Armatimonadota bacterium]|jgi:transcriptional regulator with XRE-family HTH domain